MAPNPATQVASTLREAFLLHRSGRIDEARAHCLRVLQQQPRQLEAMNLLGIIAAQKGDCARAAEFFLEVLRIDPRHLAAHNNHGNVLLALHQPAAALASYERAIGLQPGDAPSHYNRGRALFDLRRYEQAIASHDRAIELKPDYAAACFERCRALIELMRYEEAIGSLDAMIALQARHPGAWYLRANALYSLQRLEEAVASYDRLIALQPADARAHHNRGNALFMLGRHEDAIAGYGRAIALDPNLPSARAERLHARMHIADWRDFGPEVALLTARIERGEAASNPFAVLALCDRAALQMQAAGNWVREKCPPEAALGALPAPSRRERLRVGYFSAEFHDHATASLTAELFERHDRSRLELIGFAFGPDTNDELRRRIAAAFDRFLDVRGRSDEDIARLARATGIDVAVDLGGFTRGGRPGIFARRAAPIQVSYLGYLGTMSASYMDYLIADEAIIPESHRRYYSEKIAYLPSYQVNDSRRRIADRRFARDESGLPPEGFVFCCLNATYKITPSTFDRWMRILRRSPASVLWLLGGSESVEGNLRREARARGIAPERLVFAEKLPAPEYLARYRTADLFLDTLPYNAGTTGSDALWAGLPLLTCTGETFASRVGASLLRAAGLPELITTTEEEYERLAVELAGNPSLLAGIQSKLAGAARTSPLFDAALSARHLEAAYARMYERYLAGLPPEHIRLDA